MDNPNSPNAQAAVSPRVFPESRNRLIRRPEVETLTGLSRSTLYEWMKRGEFPQPVKLGARLVAWRESDIRDWLDTRETRVA